MNFLGFSSYETHIILRKIAYFQTLENSSSYDFGQKSTFSEYFSSKILREIYTEAP